MNAGPGGVHAGLLQELRETVGADQVLSDPADRLPYGYDNSRQQALPGAVVFPRDHAQVRTILALCNRDHVPVVARGRGTGTTGATVPLDGTLVLAL